MTLTDDLTAASHHLARILPAIPTWQTRTREHRRGGLPTGQNYTGTRSTRTNPIPTLDAEDRRIEQELAQVAHLARETRKALAKLEQLVYARITPAKMVDDEPPHHCENPACDYTVDAYAAPQKLKWSGKYLQCEACRQHWHRHGKLWPVKKNGELVRGWVWRGEKFVRVELEDAR